MDSTTTVDGRHDDVDSSLGVELLAYAFALLFVRREKDAGWKRSWAGL